MKNIIFIYIAVLLLSACAGGTSNKKTTSTLIDSVMALRYVDEGAFVSNLEFLDKNDAVSLKDVDRAANFIRYAQKSGLDLSEFTVAEVMQKAKDFDRKSNKRARKEFWTYSENTNDIDDSKTYFAETTAPEKLEFKFPYDGGTTVYITLRYKENKNNVMLRISKGQFMSSLSDNNTIRVRFDDAKPQIFSYSTPSDYSTETIFINNEKTFISQIKNAKKIIIECEFYNEGTQIIKFNTAGLKWEH